MWRTDQLQWRKTEERFDKELARRFHEAIYVGIEQKNVIAYILGEGNGRDLVRFARKGGEAEVAKSIPPQISTPAPRTTPLSNPVELLTNEVDRLETGIRTLAKQASNMADGLNAADPTQKAVADMLRAQAESLKDLVGE